MIEIYMCIEVLCALSINYEFYNYTTISPFKGDKLMLSPFKGDELMLSPFKDDELMLSPFKDDELMLRPFKGDEINYLRTIEESCVLYNS